MGRILFKYPSEFDHFPFPIIWNPELATRAAGITLVWFADGRKVIEHIGIYAG
jgi:hypothetical protein